MSERYIEMLLETESDELVIYTAIKKYLDDNHVVNGETWERLCEAMEDVYKIK